MTSILPYEERRVLEYLQAAADNNAEPTMMDIMSALGFESLDDVKSTLRRLERGGSIELIDVWPGFRVLRNIDGQSITARPSSHASHPASQISERGPRSEPPLLRARLSNREQEIYDFIKDCIIDRRYPPAINEIGEKFGLGPTRVYELLGKLKEKGFILLPRVVDSEGKQQRRKPHEMNLVYQQIPTPRIRVFARVPAGNPVHTEQVDDWLEIPQQLIGRNAPKEVFALIIKGNSMTDEGVLEDDYIVVRSQLVADDGDMVVARVLDKNTGELEGTVKRCRYRNGRPQLEAANEKEKENYPPLDATHAEIIGKVIGLLRFPSKRRSGL
jgi:repressor LexA